MTSSDAEFRLNFVVRNVAGLALTLGSFDAVLKLARLQPLTDVARTLRVERITAALEFNQRRLAKRLR